MIGPLRRFGGWLLAGLLAVGGAIAALVLARRRGRAMGQAEERSRQLDAQARAEAELAAGDRRIEQASQPALDAARARLAEAERRRVDAWRAEIPTDAEVDDQIRRVLGKREPPS